MLRSWHHVAFISISFLFLGSCGPTVQQLRNDCLVKENGKSCMTLAVAYEHGDEDLKVKPDAENSAKYKEEACKNGVRRACRPGPGPDPGPTPNPLERQVQACDRGSMSDCMQALIPIKAACERNEEQVCLMALPVMAKLCQSGIKDFCVKQDDDEDEGKKKAKQVVERFKRCQAGSMSDCKEVFSVFNDGCAQKDVKMCALALLVIRTMCYGDVANACEAYATIGTRLCEGGDACACGELGRLLINPHPPIQPNMRRGFALICRGCANSCGGDCDVIRQYGQRCR